MYVDSFVDYMYIVVDYVIEMFIFPDLSLIWKPSMLLGMPLLLATCHIIVYISV